MATTSLTVDNELLSATSIEAAKEARDLRHIVTPFLAEHNHLRDPVTSGLEVSRLGITLAQPENKLVTSR